jgi:hypothetical protein
MLGHRHKWIAVGFGVAAVSAPNALAASSFAGKTEAAGYAAITHYLVAHASQQQTAALGAQTEARGFLALQPKPMAGIGQLGAQTEAKGFLALQPKPVAGIGQLGAQTEAKGYRAIVRYREQVAAAPVSVSPSSTGFDWGDAFIGSAMTVGVFLLGAAAAIVVRRRQGAARLRH